MTADHSAEYVRVGDGATMAGMDDTDVGPCICGSGMDPETWRLLAPLAEALRLLLNTEALAQPLSAEDAAKVLIASTALAQFDGPGGCE